jgi:arylformamidase
MAGEQVVIDLTRSLSPETMVFPGDPPVNFGTFDAGGATITSLSLCSHSGTHIDAPRHYCTDGAGIDQVPLTHLIGRCRVIDLQGAGDEISAADLSGRLCGATRVLIRTRFSRETAFDQHYPALSSGAAALLCREKVLCVGIDSPSVERFTGDGSVHRQLLGVGIAIVELLALDKVAEGEYWLMALPLPLKGLDGAPARVVLLTNHHGEEP